MSYRLGDAQRNTPQKEFYDARDWVRSSYRPVTESEIILDHSCDSWVIGGPENVRTMIADLQALLGEIP